MPPFLLTGLDMRTKFSISTPVVLILDDGSIKLLWIAAVTSPECTRLALVWKLIE